MNAENEEAASTREPGTPPRPKVLVVDDQPANLIAARKILSKLPVEVLTAGSGEEALGLLLRHEFAVILLDVRMPGMDGYETAALMRSHTEQDPVPIVFVTAEASERRAMFQGYESGAVDYLLKPIDEDVLLAKVRIFLELHRHKRSLSDAVTALRQSNERLGRLLEAVDEGIVGIDSDRRISFANTAACRFLDTAPAQVLQRDATEVLFALVEGGGEVFAQAEAKGMHRSGEARFRSERGREFPAEYVLSAVEGARPDRKAFVLVFQDITDRRLAEEQLRRQAEIDHLTGLPNRLLFEQRVSQALVRPEGPNRPFALMFIDLDGFKPVNDRYGHAAGDYLLKGVAERLRASVRAVDVPARLGGDEFAVMLDGIVDSRDAMATGRKTVDAIAQPYDCGGQLIKVGASIGVALYPAHGRSMEALIAAADMAMYTAKRQGKGGVVLAELQPEAAPAG